MTNQPCLQVRQLTYSLKKQKLLQALSFEIPEKQKVALVGLNGAGKSTLISALAGLLDNIKGSITYPGNLPGPFAIGEHSGYQASDMMALPDLSVEEYLQLCSGLKSSIRHTSRSTNPDNNIKQVVESWGLEEHLKKPMSGLSQGNMQKLAIAQAFLGKPQYIFLDEPSQALDPLEQKRFIDNLSKLKDYKLCLFSSHNINETVQVADQVILLNKGRLIAVINLKVEHEFWLVSHLSIDKLKVLAESDEIWSVHQQQGNNLYKLTGYSVERYTQLCQKLAKEDIEFIELGQSRQTLLPLFGLLVNEVL